jgi:hypothetical protein
LQWGLLADDAAELLHLTSVKLPRGAGTGFADNVSFTITISGKPAIDGAPVEADAFRHVDPLQLAI